MAQADIKLAGVLLTLEGNTVKLAAPDLQIDYEPRRTSQTNPRRALVHGLQDKLVINFNGDYPGGVHIRGSVYVPDKLTAKNLTVEGSAVKIAAPDLEIDHQPRRVSQTGPRRALVHGFNDKLVVNFNKDYPGGVTIRGDVSIPDQLIVKNLSLYNEITALKQVIQSLESRISALEAEVPPGHNG